MIDSSKIKLLHIISCSMFGGESLDSQTDATIHYSPLRHHHYHLLVHLDEHDSCLTNKCIRHPFIHHPEQKRKML